MEDVYNDWGYLAVFPISSATFSASAVAIAKPITVADELAAPGQSFDHDLAPLPVSVSPESTILWRTARKEPYRNKTRYVKMYSGYFHDAKCYQDKPALEAVNIMLSLAPAPTIFRSL